MQVALLADTHGHLDERIAEAVAGADVIVHAGDIGNARIVSALRSRTGRLVIIRGNNDVPRKWPAADTRVLARLPEQAEVELPGGRLVVVHGDAWRARHRHARLRREFPDAAAVAYGHSHRLVVDTEHTPWVLNPGAAGRTRTYGGPSCLFLWASAVGWSVDSRHFPKT